MDFKLFRKMRCTRILLFTITAILLTNCTIQKRTYNKGYFVQWNWAKGKSKELALDTFITQKKTIVLKDSFQFQQANYLQDTAFLVEKFDLASKNTLEVFEENSNIKKKLSYSKTQATTLKIKQVPIKFKKENGKKSLKFALLSIASVLLWFLFLLFALNSSISIPIFIRVFIFVSLYLAIAIFAVLAVVFFVKAFLKPKRE